MRPAVGRVLRAVARRGAGLVPVHVAADAPAVIEVHPVDDPGDGRLEADVVALADGVTRGAAVDDQDPLADPRADRIGGDHRLGGLLAVGREGAHHQQAQALQRGVLLGRPDVADDGRDVHQEAPPAAVCLCSGRQDSGAPGAWTSSTIPTMAAS